jgi:glycosyltransferase involved in cell wall biosynthesis
MKKFSIVTPSFRNSHWLKLCVASVADQDVDHEHIIQDAGSDDGTLDWLLSDRRVRSFVEKDAGMYDALNRAMRKASGEYIAFLNCDEQYLPGTLRAARDFLDRRPDVEVLFGDAVAVNTAGDYLWHRKMLVPKPWHTATCPLSILTCGTFFRRSILDQRGIFFDPRWKYVGDGDWVRSLLRARVPMSVLKQFTSVFTHTGRNLSLEANAAREAEAYYREAPGFVRHSRPAVLAHHRLRRLLCGVYVQRPFSFSLYTLSSPAARVTKRADKPTFVWKW